MADLARDWSEGSAAIAAPRARDFHERWAMLGPPQRPCGAVVEAMRPWVAGARALLLGVTPEIAALPERTIAVDWNGEMIRTAWPGDDAHRTAILADWRALPLVDASVDCVYGDGCLSTLRWPEEARALMREIVRVLRPPGRIVLRCFARPPVAEPLETVVGDALSGCVASFGAFKLRFAMAVVGLTGDVSNDGARIHALFDRHVPDRDALAAATGWTRGAIDTIDAYAGSSVPHAYPSRAEIAAILPAGAAHRFVETAGYPLAERCPLLVADPARA